MRDGVAEAVGRLARWAAGLSWTDLPEDVRRHAALILLDDFAAMVAALLAGMILPMMVRR